MTTYGAAASRERHGWFVGLTGPQLIAVLLAAAPVWASVAQGAWRTLLVTAPGWVLVVLLVCVPVRGWSCWQWLGVLLRWRVGSAFGWTYFRAKVGTDDLVVSAHHGRGEGSDLRHHVDLERTDLPGALAAIDVHAVVGPRGEVDGLGLIQDHARHTWAATAAVVHPGIGLADEGMRDLMGAGLTTLLEAVTLGEAVRLIALHVRALPEPRRQRETWVSTHRVEHEPTASRRVHEELEALTAGAAVRHEAYVTVVVDDHRLTRGSRADRTPTARGRALIPVLAEVEAHLIGAMGCTGVRWLSADDLATVVRSGFDPGTDAGDSHPAQPWAAAGPVEASSAVREYRHGGHVSRTCTLLLPRNGAPMGALARVLVPDRPGERRSLTVLIRPLGRRAAQRATERHETSAAMAAELRHRIGRSDRARDRRAHARLRDTDEKLERGRAMVRLAIVAAVTVPDTHVGDSSDAGRRLDSAARLSGFAPQPLDGTHDAGFAAAVLPLGCGLPSGRTS